MSDFKKALDKKIIQSLKNNYGVENYDEYRFGKFPLSSNYNFSKTGLKSLMSIYQLKKLIKKVIGYN
jgi:hypothetical protein